MQNSLQTLAQTAVLARTLLATEMAMLDDEQLQARWADLLAEAEVCGDEVTHAQMAAIGVEHARRATASGPARDLLILAADGLLSIDIAQLRREIAPRLPTTCEEPHRQIARAVRAATAPVRDPASLEAYVRTDTALALLALPGSQDGRTDPAARELRMVALGTRSLLRRSTVGPQGSLDLPPGDLAAMLEAHADALIAWRDIGLTEDDLARYRRTARSVRTARRRGAR